MLNKVKRVFDVFCSSIGIIVLIPIYVSIGVLLTLDSKGPIFYRQIRVGLNNVDFKLFKFRTMHVDADKKGLLITVGGRDPRITKMGYYLRKYKLDELPQLFNVFLGDMSLVGPRPEVRHYVKMYSDEQKLVLSVKPGITDFASIAFRNENELLSKTDDPEKTYINEIMPAKLNLNLKYIKTQGFFTDIALIFKTFWAIIAK